MHELTPRPGRNQEQLVHVTTLDRRVPLLAGLVPGHGWQARNGANKTRSDAQYFPPEILWLPQLKLAFIRPVA
ncbi:MAG: hypothetical protein DME19_01505 [Verrucomicrobia bacterium]|nr:MAG: hypothetical protein DME19_01505 [Verrucomicrobiota bacterium]